jgi:hypothetical protein
MTIIKKCFLIILFQSLIFSTTFAQVPQSFNYQAVARNSIGSIISNQTVSFRISLLQGNASGLNVYSETHNVTTNQFGLVNFAVGNGIIINGNFTNIDWANGPYYAQVEIDATGGSNYTLISSTQLLSVPYALFSGKSNENSNLKTLIYTGL